MLHHHTRESTNIAIAGEFECLPVLEPVGTMVGPLAHDHRTKPLVGLVRIVRAAAQLDVRRNSLSAIGVRHEVVIFEKTCLAATPGRPNECTLATVAGPHIPLDAGAS